MCESFLAAPWGYRAKFEGHVGHLFGAIFGDLVGEVMQSLWGNVGPSPVIAWEIRGKFPGEVLREACKMTGALQALR